MEEVQPTNEQLLEQGRSILRYKKFILITNIILILVLIGIAYYVISNVELLKILNSDVCKMCMDKTGANCYLPIN